MLPHIPPSGGYPSVAFKILGVCGYDLLMLFGMYRYCAVNVDNSICNMFLSRLVWEICLVNERYHASYLLVAKVIMLLPTWLFLIL